MEADRAQEMRPMYALFLPGLENMIRPAAVVREPNGIERPPLVEGEPNGGKQSWEDNVDMSDWLYPLGCDV